MSISRIDVTKVDDLKFKMKVNVVRERMDSEIKKRLQDIGAKVTIAGFRPGKVPMNIIRKRFGDSIRGEVISELLKSTYIEAIQQEKLMPAGPPTIELITAVEGKELEYVATFETYPMIDLKTLDSLEIEGLKVDLNDQDVDEVIETLRKQQATWNQVDRPAQEGDQVVIDFEGLMEGETFQGGSGKEVTLELGSGAAVPGFEAGLVGANSQATIHLNITFPEDYYDKNLAGKPAQITVKVHRVLEPILPNNEALAEKLNIQESSLEQIRAEVRENLEREIQRITKDVMKERVLEKIIEVNPIPVPEALVEAEAEKLYNQAAQNLAGKRGAESVPPPKEHFLALAKKRVHLGLLFAEIVRAKHIHLDEAQVQQMLEQLAAPYKNPEQVLAWYRNNKDQMDQINMAVLETQVVEELLKEAKVVDKVVPYRDFHKAMGIGASK